jgi:hypothetical protein
MGNVDALVVVIAGGARPVAPPGVEDASLRDWQPATRALASGHKAWCATFSSTALELDPDGTLAEAESVLAAWGRTGAAAFGFLTRHEAYQQDPHLSDLVGHVGARGWMALRDQPFDLWLVTEPRPAPVLGAWRQCGPWGVVMAQREAGDEDVIVRIPLTGWHVVRNDLRDLEPLALPAHDERWRWFTEELLHLRREATGETVTIGWSPPRDPDGRYVIVHTDSAGRPLGAELESTLTRDAVAAVTEILAAATDE